MPTPRPHSSPLLFSLQSRLRLTHLFDQLNYAVDFSLRRPPAPPAPTIQDVPRALKPKISTKIAKFHPWIRGVGYVNDFVTFIEHGVDYATWQYLSEPGAVGKMESVA